MVACHVGVRLWVAALLLYSAAGLPSPLKPVPVQICTTTDGAIFTVMRDSLLFLPPNKVIYVAKQLWRASTLSTTAFVSLQIYQPDTALGSVSTVDPRRFITRDGGAQPKNFTPGNAFQDFENERRLFKVQKCDPGQGPASVTFFSQQGSVLNVLSRQLDDGSQLLRLSIISKNEAISCRLANLQIQEFPLTVPSSGDPHPSSVQGRRRRSIDSLAVRVQLLVDYGTEQFVVGVSKQKFGDSFELRIRPYRAKSCTSATTFYYQGYNEYHVQDKTGSLISRPAFTLQHVATRLYVTSDVLDNMALNISGTGVTLQNETEFDSEQSGFPDYRYFSRYDDEALNFATNSYGLLKRNISYYRRQVHILCAVHHRRYCLLPSKSGQLQFVAVSSIDESAFPTFADPAGGFFDFLENLNGSSIIPTFRFLPI